MQEDYKLEIVVLVFLQRIWSSVESARDFSRVQFSVRLKGIFIGVHLKEVYCIGFHSLHTLDDDGWSQGDRTKLMACSFLSLPFSLNAYLTKEKTQVKVCCDLRSTTM